MASSTITFLIMTPAPKEATASTSPLAQPTLCVLCSQVQDKKRTPGQGARGRESAIALAGGPLLGMPGPALRCAAPDLH